jgi:hypothetical protein
MLKADGRGAISVLKIAPGQNALYWEDCKKGGYICVGWDFVGDLRKFTLKDELERELRKKPYEYPPPTAAHVANELWALRDLEPGDKVIANNGKSAVKAVGTVAERGYFWKEDGLENERKEYFHHVAVRWDKEWIPDLSIRRQNVWGHTVVPVTRQLFKSITGRNLPQSKSKPSPPDLSNDERKRIRASIVQRQGQPAFREELLVTYSRRCAVSRCYVASVLEAAHIRPYSGEESNHPCNGILLRADLHLLFDQQLLTIEPEDFHIKIDQRLRGTEYWKFNARRLRLPKRKDQHPSRDWLKWRRRSLKRWSDPNG